MTEIVLIVALALLIGSIVSIFWNKATDIQSSLEPSAPEVCSKYGLEKDYYGRCPLCWQEPCKQWETPEWRDWRRKHDAPDEEGIETGANPCARRGRRG
jgi:hypothetical protein